MVTGMIFCRISNLHIQQPRVFKILSIEVLSDSGVPNESVLPYSHGIILDQESVIDGSLLVSTAVSVFEGRESLTCIFILMCNFP